MSKLLKKEGIIAKSFSGFSAKKSAKSVKKQDSFNHHSTNNGSVVTSKQLPQLIADEEVFVSPVKSSIKVKMKVRISGKVLPIPVDSEDVVFFDE